MFASQGQSMIISARENAMHDLQCKVPTPHRNLVTSVRQIRAFGLPTHRSSVAQGAIGGHFRA